MKIGILSRKPSLYSTGRLKEAGEQRGHRMHVIDYLRCYMDITSHKPKLIYRGEPLEEFDAIIPRIAASAVSTTGRARRTVASMMARWRPWPAAMSRSI